MNCFELMALRKLFFLEIHEICAYFSCSKRLWRKWESGELGVPAHIQREMEHLLQEREVCSQDLFMKFENDWDDFMFRSLDYYHSFENYRKHCLTNCIVQWRIYQSILANMIRHYVDDDFYLCSNIAEESSRCKGIKKYLYFYKKKRSENRLLLARQYRRHRELIESVRAVMEGERKVFAMRKNKE